MGHEATDRARGKKVASDAAEDPFAEATMSVSASHEQIRRLRPAQTGLTE